MNMQLSRIHFPVTTLGYGKRLCIWTQGCHLRCPGCINRDTWHPDMGFVMTVPELFRACSRCFAHADGFTITGGEPFEQPEALVELLTLLRASHGGDILVFSGFERDRLLDHPVVAAGLVDVLISGPYLGSSGQTLTLRGSDNQRIDLLTSLARARYPEDIDQRPWAKPRRLDLFPAGDGLFMAGIPEPGWGHDFQNALTNHGFTCRTSDQP